MLLNVPISLLAVLPRQPPSDRPEPLSSRQQPSHRSTRTAALTRPLEFVWTTASPTRAISDDDNSGLDHGLDSATSARHALSSMRLHLHDSALEDGAAAAPPPCDLTPQHAAGGAAPVVPSSSPAPVSTAVAPISVSRLGLRSPKAGRSQPGQSPTGSTSTRKSLFSFPWRAVKRQNSTELQQASVAAMAAAQNAVAVPPSPSHATATAPAASGEPGATQTDQAAAPRRRWFRYPVRVPILSLLLVSLLARTSEGWTSIAGFLCGFLLFEGFSAPDTGQPNRIDAVMKRLIASIQRCKRRRRHRNAAKRRAARIAAEAGGTDARARRCSCVTSLLRALRKPFSWCARMCRRRRHSPHGYHSAATSVPSAMDGATVAPLLLDGQPGAPPVEEDSDVLLDVALSVTEDAQVPPSRPPSTEPTAAVADSSLTPPNAVAAAASEVLGSAPLHALSELADSLSVSSLDAADTAADDATTTVVGGRAHFANVSVSLRFTFRAFHIHVHHWVYLLFVFGFLFLEQTLWAEHAASYPVYAFASAFCLGGSVQGLKYADWARVIWRRTQDARHERHHSASGHGGGGNGGGATPVAAAAHRDGAPHHSRHPSRAHGDSRASTDMHSPTEAMDRMESGESSALLGGGGGGGVGVAAGLSGGARQFEYPADIDDSVPSPMPLARQLSQTHAQLAQLNLHV